MTITVNGDTFTSSVGTPWNIPAGVAVFVQPGSGGQVLDYTATLNSYKAMYGTDPTGASSPNPNATAGSADYEMSRTYYSNNPSQRFQDLNTQYQQQQGNTLTYGQYSSSGISRQSTSTPTPVYDMSTAAGIAAYTARQGGSVTDSMAAIARSEGYTGQLNTTSGISTIATPSHTYAADIARTGSTRILASDLSGPSATFYTPVGSYAQVEIPDAKAVISESGEISIYAPYYIGGQKSRYLSLVSGGGRNSLQSGMFSVNEPLTSTVYTQSALKDFTPATSKTIDTMSRLGAEAYGGYVTTLDNRTIESTGAKLSTYIDPNNLANLVSPEAVNLGKAELPGAAFPWTISAGSPTIQFADQYGLTGKSLNIGTQVQKAAGTLDLSEGTYSILGTETTKYTPSIQVAGLESPVAKQLGDTGLYTVPLGVFSTGSGIGVEPGSTKVSVVSTESDYSDFWTNLRNSAQDVASDLAGLVGISLQKGSEKVGSTTISKEYTATLPSPYVANAPEGYTPGRVGFEVKSVETKAGKDVWGATGEALGSFLPEISSSEERIALATAKPQTAAESLYTFGRSGIISGYSQFRENPLDFGVTVVGTTALIAATEGGSALLSSAAEGTRFAGVTNAALKIAPAALLAGYVYTGVSDITSGFKNYEPGTMGTKAGEFAVSSAIPLALGAGIYRAAGKITVPDFAKDFGKTMAGESEFVTAPGKSTVPSITGTGSEIYGGTLLSAEEAARLPKLTSTRSYDPLKALDSLRSSILDVIPEKTGNIREKIYNAANPPAIRTVDVYSLSSRSVENPFAESGSSVSFNIDKFSQAYERPSVHIPGLGDTYIPFTKATRPLGEATIEKLAADTFADAYARARFPETKGVSGEFSAQGYIIRTAETARGGYIRAREEVYGAESRIPEVGSKQYLEAWDALEKGVSAEDFAKIVSEPKSYRSGRMAFGKTSEGITPVNVWEKGQVISEASASGEALRLTKVLDISPYVYSIEKTSIASSRGNAIALEELGVTRELGVTEKGTPTFEGDIGKITHTELYSEMGEYTEPTRTLRASETINEILGSKFPAKGKPVIGEYQGIIQNALDKLTISNTMAVRGGAIEGIRSSAGNLAATRIEETNILGRIGASGRAGMENIWKSVIERKTRKAPSTGILPGPESGKSGVVAIEKALEKSELQVREYPATAPSLSEPRPTSGSLQEAAERMGAPGPAKATRVLLTEDESEYVGREALRMREEATGFRGLQQSILEKTTSSGISATLATGSSLDIQNAIGRVSAVSLTGAALEIGNLAGASLEVGNRLDQSIKEITAVIPTSITEERTEITPISDLIVNPARINEPVVTPVTDTITTPDTIQIPAITPDKITTYNPETIPPTEPDIVIPYIPTLPSWGGGGGSGGRRRGYGKFEETFYIGPSRKFMEPKEIIKFYRTMRNGRIAETNVSSENVKIVDYSRHGFGNPFNLPKLSLPKRRKARS